MPERVTWWMILGLLVFIVVFTYLQVWVIHWAVSLFYPISMWQAFGIAVLLDMLRFGNRKK